MGKEPEKMIDTLKVKILMVRKSWNQKKLSKKAGVRESTLSNIMNGKSRGRPETWLKLADALEVDVKEILDNKITKKEQTR